MSTARHAQRTMERCRKLGWHVSMVEKWNQHAHIRQDLFGGIDILAMVGKKWLLGIQVTDLGGMGDHVEKLNGLDTMKAWVGLGLRLEVWGWRKIFKRGPDGKRLRRKKDGALTKQKVWKPRRMVATLDADGDLEWDDVDVDA